ncbi:MAG: hypothetical protein NT172_15210 [Planctomycetota bacterium]|nr:hypothetical protein [Planctomycetota bacterium]
MIRSSHFHFLVTLIGLLTMNLPEFHKYLHEVKHLKAALEIKVHDQSMNQIGTMVPLTTQHLNDAGLLEDFATWRNRHPEAWLDQRPVSGSSTRKWLENLLNDDQRIAFLILNTDRLIIGRAGIMDIGEKSAMTDSLIRGRMNASPNLLFFSYVKLLKWVVINTGIDHVDSKMVSQNVLSNKLHVKTGFEIVGVWPLYEELTPTGPYLNETQNQNGDEYPLSSFQLIKWKLNRSTVMADDSIYARLGDVASDDSNSERGQCGMRLS